MATDVNGKEIKAGDTCKLISHELIKETSHGKLVRVDNMIDSSSLGIGMLLEIAPYTDNFNNLVTITDLEQDGDKGNIIPGELLELVSLQ